jgi:hypothetical protein
MSVLPGKMESASAPTGMVAVSLDSELEQLADAAVADWPDISFSGEFDAAIIDLYWSHLQFPPSWTQEQRDEFITSNAEMDSLALTERFDDVIDTVIDGYVRRHGILPHSEDAEALIGSARRSAIYDLEFCLMDLADEIANATIHGLGHANASMTACSPADRRSQPSIRRTTRRRRR